MGNYFYFGIDMKCARRINISLLTESRIAQNFPRLEIKFIFNSKSIKISCEVSAIAIIQCQI